MLALALLAQTAPSTDIFSSFLPGIVSLGGFGLLLMLILTGYLVTKKNYDEMKQDRDDWRNRSDAESALRVKAQEALTIALEQGQTTALALEEIRQLSAAKRQSRDT